MLGRAMTFEIRAQQLVIGSYSLFGIGIELALSLLSEAAANWWSRRTLQPTSTATDSRKPAANSVLVALPAPRIFSDLWRYYDRS